ncbi:hypothetical protein BOTNAR_0480g00020 [Botryotinia narcissicola]|uniref:MARVEL domain-containing protein n=1 Tax=Botryotinia narcissicola TaxID=278944 RepID=A0A4Z1HH83_9HELO|nr:hypothetical protein BOTNAR_0480g00020 [Botryotinia narcissicola]
MTALKSPSKRLNSSIVKPYTATYHDCEFGEQNATSTSTSVASTITMGFPIHWGFLMICAGWTVLTVIFYTIARISFLDDVVIGYIHVAVETVAVLSWLAGFITLAVQVSTDTYSTGKPPWKILIMGTVFGALG